MTKHKNFNLKISFCFSLVLFLGFAVYSLAIAQINISAQTPQSVDDCIKNYQGKGYSYEEAKKVCIDESKNVSTEIQIPELIKSPEIKPSETKIPEAKIPETKPVQDSCIQKYIAEFNLSYEEAEMKCYPSTQKPTTSPIEGCVKKYTELGYSSEEIKKVCAQPTPTFDKCANLKEKLMITTEKILKASEEERKNLEKEIQQIKQELADCEKAVPFIVVPQKTVLEKVTPQIKNPCDEASLLKESLGQLYKKIGYLKELIIKGEKRETELEPYYKEELYLKERLEKMNFACQQGKPVEESPCVKLNQAEAIYRQIQEMIAGSKDAKEMADLKTKLSIVTKEILSLKERCRATNIAAEKPASFLELEKVYETKVKEAVETKSSEKAVDELKKIEEEKRKLIEEFALKMKEFDLRKTTIVKKLKIDKGEVFLEETKAQAEKIKIEVKGELVELSLRPDLPGKEVIITDNNVSAKGNIALEYSEGKLIASKSGKEIKILPSEVKEKIKRGLKEIRIKDEEIPKYVAIAKRKGKLFWFIPLSVSWKYEIDAEKGKVLEKKKPWWDFTMKYIDSDPEEAAFELKQPDVTYYTQSINNGPREEGIRVDLINWWQEVLPSMEIELDPIGGPAYLFWLDEDGNICRGEPGVDGRPGKIELYPSRLFTEIMPTVRNRDRWPISAETLRRLQNDTYNLSDTLSSGNYIFQYAVQFWRGRSNGAGIEDYSRRLSLPIDFSLSERYVAPANLRPIAVLSSLSGGRYDCGWTQYGLPVPETGLGTGQHPTKCLSRQRITASELINACLEGRLEGSFSSGYFLILR